MRHNVNQHAQGRANQHARANFKARQAEEGCTHAPAHAEPHAHAHAGDDILARANEARPCHNCPRLPEARTPHPVPRHTPVSALREKT
ncbi:hypothetical protein JCGZ_00484 [Jatropha curcas]|uniref:Uncharacterized protein n=1 Tax=Jatropha curcas TaxID=180498 RepID=A0A067LE64_JATCU|nr:hypothetical protein JCGZ_00484 [Jatropha curcas]